MEKCQWIDGDPLGSDWCFCEAPVVHEDASWCAEHYRRVYQGEKRAANDSKRKQKAA